MREYLPLLPGSAFIILGIMLTAGLHPPWLLLAITAGIFLASYLVRRDGNDRILYRTLAGVPLTITLAAVFFWAGVIALCGILLLLFAEEEIAGGWKNPAYMAGCCLAVLAIGAVIDISNHMLFPFLVIAGISAGIFGALNIFLYRTKRTFAWGKP